jgi:hypothetical protein
MVMLVVLGKHRLLDVVQRGSFMGELLFVGSHLSTVVHW